MKRLYKSMSISIILLLIIFLTSCATRSAIAKLPHGEHPSESSVNAQATINKETKNTSIRVDNIGSVEEIQELTDNEDAEEDTLLKELPGINGDTQTIIRPRIEGGDRLIESELKRIMLEFGEDEDVPEVFLKEVIGYVRIFQTNLRYRKFVTASLRRSSTYLPMAKFILSERNIPEDMAYIAFIESGFNPRALSHAGALGMWQFMPKTARNYSLKVSRGIDERFDPIKSTYAAVDYFHDLIAIFGPKSFLLAMAAYNCGEGKVIACLKEIENPFEDRNFWHIRPCLSNETREYPPKIIASAIIGNNPEAFGFPKFEGNEDEIIDKAMLVDYKPDKNRVIPAVYKKTSTKPEEETARKPLRNKNSEKTIKHKPIIYTVKKGNNLSLIAEVFGMEKDDIKKWNRLKDDKLLAVQVLKIYPKISMEKIQYTVKKGDTLAEIAESFKMRPKNIVICNGFKNEREIKTGQTLVFYKTIEKKPVMYTIKKGTTLTHIANTYNVRVRDIMMWNNLSSTTLYAGQKLKIYAKTSQDT